MENHTELVPSEAESRPLLRYLQNMQDNFAHTTQMAAFILRPNGQRLTATSGHTELFNTLLSNPSSASMLNENIVKVYIQARKARRAQVLDSSATGLRIAAVPLFIEDEYYYWVTGQVRSEVHLDYYDSFAIQLAHATGLSSKLLKIQYCNLSEMSNEQFTHNLNLLKSISVPSGYHKASAELPRGMRTATALAGPAV